MEKIQNHTHLEDRTLYASISASFLIVMIMLFIGYLFELLQEESSKQEDSQHIYPREYVEFRPSIHC